MSIDFLLVTAVLMTLSVKDTYKETHEKPERTADSIKVTNFGNRCLRKAFSSQWSSILWQTLSLRNLCAVATSSSQKSAGWPVFIQLGGLASCSCMDMYIVCMLLHRIFSAVRLFRKRSIQFGFVTLGGLSVN